jgi:hypothetical protein
MNSEFAKFDLPREVYFPADICAEAAKVGRYAQATCLEHQLCKALEKVQMEERRDACQHLFVLYGDVVRSECLPQLWDAGKQAVAGASSGGATSATPLGM